MSPSRRLLPKVISEVRLNSPPLVLQQTAKPFFTYACDACHKRKVKCDRQRPECSACKRLGRTCTRSRRQTIVTTGGDDKFRQIAAFLNALPEHEAAELIQQLVTQATAVSGLPKQISEHELLRNTLLPCQNSVEFELSIRHPSAYPTLNPLHISTLPLDSLLRPNEITRPHTARKSSSSMDLDPLRRATPDSSQLGDVDSRREGLIHEFASMPLFNNRLRDVQIQVWTKVAIENNLAIRIISFYFELDYPINPLFNADLFIEDLAQGRRWFCSELLVNSLLCCACQIYTPFDPRMPDLSVEFLNEATRALSRETHRNTLTTCAALQLLSISTICLGLNDDSLIYLREGVKIGTRMGLFNSLSESGSANPWLDDHQDWKRAASYTAWGVFNWVVLHGIHFNLPEIETPPMLPRPGALHNPPATKAEMRSKVTQHTELFDSTCELRVIMNDILWQYYGVTKKGKLNHITVGVAEAAYRRLLAWAANLPLGQVRGDQSNHAIITMHVHLHATIVDVFRPLIASPCRATPLRSFASSHATPEAIYAASINQLKRLLLIYRLYCKLGLFSSFCHTIILYVVNAMVHEASTAAPSGRVAMGIEWHIYLDICLAGYQSLFGSFRSFGSGVKGMLAMALRHGVISADRAGSVASDLHELGRKYNAVEGIGDGTAQAGWIVDQDLGMIDPRAAAGGVLADELQNLMIYDDTETPVEEGSTGF